MPDRKNHQTPTLEKWPKICVETYSPTNAVARKIPESVLPYKGCIPCVAWPSVPSEFNNSSTISCNSSSSSSDAIGIIALPVISGSAHESPLAPVFSGWESGAWESSVAAADRKLKCSKNASAIYTWLCRGNSCFTRPYFRGNFFVFMCEPVVKLFYLLYYHSSYRIFWEKNQRMFKDFWMTKNNFPKTCLVQ